MPSVRALNDPPPWRAAYLSDQRLLTAPSDVRLDPAYADCGHHVRIVVALVQTEMLRASRPTWATHDDGVEHLADHTRVWDVRARDDCGNWHAATIGQNVPLYATFCPVRRIWSREVPPFGAFTEALSKELHFNAAPRRP